jgi:hypothetical protein
MALPFVVAIIDSMRHTRIREVYFATEVEALAWIENYNRDSDLHIKARLDPFCD